LSQYVQSRAYLFLNVAIAAIAAAGVVVGLTLDTRSVPRQPAAQKGKPPVPTSLPGAAGAKIEAAFAGWPHGSIDAMQRLGLEYAETRTPAERATSAMVEYYRGFALYWAGYPADATTALQTAKRVGRNTLWQEAADNFLHPQFFQPPSGPGYPVFVPVDSKDPLLVQGSRLQQQGHQESAETLFQKAARLHPASDEAQVAAAVGLFDEDNLTPAFSRLGPLTQRFPKSQIAHYYLALLSAWTAQGQAAITQFEQVVTLGPGTTLGQTAKKALESIATDGTSKPSK
jgi:tetratricopeptide (TPR) repeat protein